MALLDKFGEDSREWHFDSLESCPILIGRGAPYISLSHSLNMLACALCSCPVGLDVEFRQKRDFHDLAKFMCSPLEWNVFVNLPESERGGFFYRLWTAKEAVFKLQGKERFSQIFDSLAAYNHRSMLETKDNAHTGWVTLRPNFECAWAVAGCQSVHIVVHEVDESLISFSV